MYHATPACWVRVEADGSVERAPHFAVRIHHLLHACVVRVESGDDLGATRVCRRADEQLPAAGPGGSDGRLIIQAITLRCVRGGQAARTRLIRLWRNGVLADTKHGVRKTQRRDAVEGRGVRQRPRDYLARLPSASRAANWVRRFICCVRAQEVFRAARIEFIRVRPRRLGGPYREAALCGRLGARDIDRRDDGQLKRKAELGIPTIAGPGAISTVMALVGQATIFPQRVALASAIGAGLYRSAARRLQLPVCAARAAPARSARAKATSSSQPAAVIRASPAIRGRRSESRAAERR